MGICRGFVLAVAIIFCDTWVVVEIAIDCDSMKLMDFWSASIFYLSR